ncbi:MAG: hypothetical protein ACYCX2_07670 [Christensenellales bacterium]
MLWIIGFSLYGFILALLLWSMNRNVKTKGSGDHLEQYIPEMTDKVTKKAGTVVFAATALSLLLPVVLAAIGWLIQRFVFLPASGMVYILSSGWYSLVVPALFSFTLAFEFLLRSKWKRYAVSALYARNTAPPNYQSRKRFLLLQTVFFAIAFPFYIFALGNYTCFTGTDIRFSEYFSPAEYRFSYNDVLQTESKMVTDSYGNPDMLYTISFSGGKTISYRLSAYQSEIPKMQELIEAKGNVSFK